VRARLTALAAAVVCAALWPAAPAAAHQAEASPQGKPDLPGPVEDYFDLTGWAPEPWEPFEGGDLEFPAGTYCPFELHIRTVEDDEETRVDSRYADGSVHVREYRGKLVVDFVNAATGHTVRRDVSGEGAEEYRPDGSTEVFGGVGPFGIGFEDTDYPTGYYVLDGVHVVTKDPGGRRHMALDKGFEENMCETLA
jgi:hypothetical protein